MHIAAIEMHDGFVKGASVHGEMLIRRLFCGHNSSLESTLHFYNLLIAFDPGERSGI